jgi:phosphoribosyl-ATP pyrophosphohydrolase
MSTENKFKELQELSKNVHAGAIQVNSKIESAQENLERFLPTLKDKYPEIAKKFKDITDLKNVDKIIEEMENLVKEWESENERVYKESSDKLNHLSVQVQEKNATIRNIQNSMRQ